MTEFPPIDEALIKALELAFPDRSPSIHDSDRDIWRKTGSVEVVRYLRARYEAQNDVPEDYGVGIQLT